MLIGTMQDVVIPPRLSDEVEDCMALCMLKRKMEVCGIALTAFLWACEWGQRRLIVAMDEKVEKKYREIPYRELDDWSGNPEEGCATITATWKLGIKHDELQTIQDAVDRYGFKDFQELLLLALQFWTKTVRAVVEGRVIASLDEDEGKYQEMTMDYMKRISALPQ